MHERSNALISFALMSAAALLTLTRWHRRTVLRLQAQKSLSLSVPTPDLRRKGFNFSGSERRSGHSRGHGAVCRLTSNERPPEGLSGTFRGKDGRSRDGGRRNEAGAGFQPDAGHPQIVKVSQSQHGLRHGDHTRYRQYCTRRLARMYKALNFSHGRGKYQKRALSPEVVADANHLMIPLISAERAWSYAMELKTGAGNDRESDRT